MGFLASVQKPCCLVFPCKPYHFHEQLVSILEHFFSIRATLFFSFWNEEKSWRRKLQSNLLFLQGRVGSSQEKKPSHSQRRKSPIHNILTPAFSDIFTTELNYGRVSTIVFSNRVSLPNYPREGLDVVIAVPERINLQILPFSSVNTADTSPRCFFTTM